MKFQNILFQLLKIEFLIENFMVEKESIILSIEELLKLTALSVRDTKGVKRKLNGLNCEAMKTTPFCSPTFLYPTGKIVSIVESIKKGNAQKKALKP
jgi:hypothetical protein